MKDYLNLFIAFFKIGAFTFGGGYAMLPILQREVVEKHHWVTEEELSDIYAIGQCTPGIIAANTATFVGYKIKGILGSLVATFAIVLPSCIIISLIAMVLSNFADIPAVKHAFNGIRACVCAMMLSTVIKMWKGAVKDKIGFGIFAVTLVISFFTDVSSAILVVIAGALGVVILFIRKQVAE